MDNLAVDFVREIFLSEVRAAQRWCEVRIGELLGKPPGKGKGGGRGHKVSFANDSLTKDERADFRLMAEHEDVVAISRLFSTARFFALQTVASGSSCPFIMTNKQYRALGGQSGTPRQFPQPRPKPNMDQPVRNLRGVESVPTSRFPQRKTLPPQ